MFLVSFPGLSLGFHHWNMSHTVASSWARSLCPHRKGTRRYKQWVEFYSWKYEKRVNRNVAWQGVAVVHNAWVGYVLLRQLLRFAMALQAIVLAAAR